MDLRFDYNPEFGQTRFLDLTGVSTTWDASIWDRGSYGTAARRSHRFRIGRTGRAWAMRIRNPVPNAPIILHRLGAQAELMTTKR